MVVRKILVGLLVANFVVGGYAYKTNSRVHKLEEPVIEVPVVGETVEVEEVVEEVKPIVTTTYRVTAYCPCEKCCGKWAKNRPLDENGEPIVVGAAGVELVSGYTVAGTLPFGTKVELEGIGVVEVQDRFAKWIVDKYGENIIDIYMTDHKAAWNFGEQYIEGVVLE